MPEQWKNLTDEDQIKQIISDSDHRPQIIYKHSTRCPVSSRAYRRVSKISTELAEIADIYYLDVLADRPVSNAVARQWEIRHESPQLLIIHNGEVIWHESHGAIREEPILEALEIQKERS